MERTRFSRGRLLGRGLFLTGVRALACLAVIGSAARGDEPAAPEAEAKIDFETDVAPILRQHCIDCHGPAMQMADLRLDQRQFAIVDGQDRGLITPGHGADSLLIQRLVDPELGLIMPPTFPFFPQDKMGLPETQVRILSQWIDEGAPWPEGISLADEPAAADASRDATFFAAIRAGDADAIGRLLAERSLANAADRHGATALMQAALYADAALMRLLIEHGADVNAADPSGATALMWGAGDLDKVRLLVEHGAHVDARSAIGRTPLLIACTYAGNTEVVRLLLQSGANIADRDMFGETALTSASKRGGAQLVEALIEAGADVLRPGGFQGRSPLAWAADEGDTETIACLLKHGAGKDAASLNAALFNASVRGSAAAVRLLLEHGADARARSGFARYTPLMGAAYSDTAGIQIVQLLIRHGADVQSKAATGETALVLARKHGRTEIVEMLEQSGAAE